MVVPNSWFRSGPLAVVALLAPLLVLAAACGDTASVSQLPDKPVGTGGTDVGSGGSGARGGSSNMIDLGGMNNGGADEQGGAGSQTKAVCGNDSLEPGEICDDGNTKDGDGCNADCTVADPDFLCTEGKGCVRVVTCGNGVIEGDEVCDDGNTKSGDGCSKKCDAIEDGFICVKPGEPCVELPVCGNGVREQGEQCDDKNDQDDDGCSSTCQVESGYFCPPGEACVKLECGDGSRTPDEQCDDGNDKDGDGCAKDCTVETGWLCSSSGCKPICGDGVVLGAEQCDDGNPTSGDGCSSACKVEPFYNCNSAQPTICTSSIVCGDGVLSPGEVCDPGISGQDACYSTAEDAALACKAFDTGLVDPAHCNNGVVEYMEECDGGSGNIPGCTNCTIDDGYVCPAAGVCFKLPKCGDGLLQAGEKCDLGLVSAPGCDSNCQIEPNYFCSGEPSVCVKSVCGDGVRAPDEECDDGPGTASNPGTPVGGDGCSATCTVEAGFACPPGGCLPICGDGIKTGGEECDLGASPNPTACANCKLKPGYKCGTNGLGPCVATVCGNGAAITDPINSVAYVTKAKAAAEPGEGCDDGNTVAGDGCGPTCQLEPAVTVGPSPTVAVTCGDGLVTAGEDCDDGNTASGDGCSSLCKVESGWTCDPQVSYPDSIKFRVTYRDFKQRDQVGGHPHMKVDGAGNPATAVGSPGQGSDPGIVGPVCTTALNNNTAPYNCGRLDANGKPEYAGTDAAPHTTIDTAGDGAGLDAAYHKKAFALWYRDTNTGTGAVLDALSQVTGSGTTNLIQIAPNPAPVPAGGDTLTLGKQTGLGNPATPSAYQFSTPSFYPLDPNNRGYGTFTTSGATHNWQFTSELRYFFQYQGGETLTFYGDDDVWVFVNGRLAVDIGGIHGQTYGRVVLGNDGDGGVAESSCTVNEGTSLPACAAFATGYDFSDDKRFGLTKGGVYEIVVFQAERHPTGSNYQLTLQGFIAPRSSCHTTCGDNIRAGSEMCDNGSGMPGSGYGVCLNNCTIQFCGDKIKNGTEACDTGANSTLYGTTGCAPGCVLPPNCGDGTIQASAGEQCDKGTSANTGAYNGCTSTCQLGPYCGDGQQNGTETCDPPDHVFATYGQGKCNYNCKAAPYCGDGIRNGTEICDGTPNCNANCEFDPYCGDGLKTSDEACDYGQFNFSGAAKDAPYGGCTTMCDLGPYCGDDTVQTADGEECDNGKDNADNVYGGCTTACLEGPRCGDGVRQKAAGEACDNGFNEDDYAYPGDANPCGKNCTAVPSCGDGTVQPAFELCDDGSKNDDSTYNGCTTTCEWGPYCGDSIKNGPEECDDGPDNKAYSTDGKGCSYECKKNLPYCGDGVRNGPEQCDLGKSMNDGSYGGCNDDCTKAAFCGDGKIQRSNGEQCDDGPTGSLTCTPTCRQRDTGIR